FGTENDEGHFIPTEKNVNIAIGKKAKASSHSIGNEACSTIRSNPNTMWQAETHHLPQWLLIDLEDFYTVVGAKILWGKDSTHYAYKILASKDGWKWEDVVDKVTTGSYYRPIDFSIGYPIRFVKIWVYNIL